MISVLASVWKFITGVCYWNSNLFPPIVVHQWYFCVLTHGWFTMAGYLVLCFAHSGFFFWSWIPCWSCTGTRYVCLAKANDGCCSYNSSWRSWHGAIGAFKECNVWTWHQLSFAVFIYTVICEFVLNYLVPVVWDSLYEHWTMYALWSAVFSLHHDVCRAGHTDLPIVQNVAFSFYIQPVRWQW